jgi:hypothetical protein
MDKTLQQVNAKTKRTSPLEATRQALAAAVIGDLAAVRAALELRRAALPAAPVAQRAAAFKEGEALQFLLQGIKRRLRADLGRLEQIKTGLVRSAEPRAAKIDLRA